MKVRKVNIVGNGSKKS